MKKLFGKHSTLLTLTLFVLSLLIWYIPEAIMVGLLFTLIGIVFFEAIKFLVWFNSTKKIAITKVDKITKVSIHMAIHNEPSEMVISTIQSVLAQNYSNFELIIVDNNTNDPELWERVEEYCTNFENIRFFHLKNWPHYKSGALNFARKVTAKDSDYIFVLDADYELHSNALNVALGNACENHFAIVQFPQSYRYHKEKHKALISEFGHFFNYFCLGANRCYGSLATGTLSLISISALDSIGGWPINSITEDAELGVRFQSAGYHIKYVNRIIGQGIAPIQQTDFIRQRKRWIYGNIQTLIGFMVNSPNDFQKWISGIAQLTAWANLLGIPILTLICCLVLKSWMNGSLIMSISTLCYTSLWVFTISKLGQLLLVRGDHEKNSLHIFLIQILSWELGAFHWWPVVFGYEQPFLTTNKRNRRTVYRVNLLYILLHFGHFFIWFHSEHSFLTFSGFIFFILYTVASVYDCWCRNDNVRNLRTSFRILL